MAPRFSFNLPLEVWLSQATSRCKVISLSSWVWGTDGSLFCDSYNLPRLSSAAAFCSQTLSLFTVSRLKSGTSNFPIQHRLFCRPNPRPSHFFLNSIKLQENVYVVTYTLHASACENLSKNKTNQCMKMQTMTGCHLKNRSMWFYHWSLAKFIFLTCHLPVAKATFSRLGHLSNWLELAAAAGSCWWSWTHTLSGLTPPARSQISILPGPRWCHLIRQKNPFGFPVYIFMGLWGRKPNHSGHLADPWVSYMCDPWTPRAV